MSIAECSLADHLSRRRTLCFTHAAGEVFLRGRSLVRRAADGAEEAVPLADIRRVILLGRAPVPSAVLYRLMRAGIPADWLDVFGRPLGQVLSLDADADRLVGRQAAFARRPEAFELMRAILLARCDNAREVLRRKVPSLPDWRDHRGRLERAATPDALRGAEGLAARDYFSHWGGLLPGLSWSGRRAWPAPDPANLLLSFGYGLLHNRLSSALRHAGLNPREGFFHVGRGRHCALASDLMEPLRPFVDAAALGLLRRRRLTAERFAMRGDRCVFRDGEAFSLALTTFEEMFARPRVLWLRRGGEWTEIRRTLNDHLDDLALGHARMISAGESCGPARMRPCAA